MEETIDYERIEAEVRKLEYNLFEAKTPMSMANRLILLNVLRYDLGLIEDRDKVKKVVYNGITKKLEYSRSVEIGVAISISINDEIRAEQELEMQQKLYKVMQETYYYLARYLFEYFYPTMEFGIPPEKQFIAPRTCVLNRVAREMSKFYYRQDRPIMTLSMPQGTRKEQPLSSKILTPTGWITMGDVKVGTKVIGADGKPCNVTGVYPKGVKDIYRVTFDDHTYVDCGLEHLWEVQTRSDRAKNNPPRVVNTKQMIENVNLKRSDGKRRNYSIRMVKPVEFDNQLEKDDIDAYLLGCLLGNGNLKSNQIRFTCNDEEVIDNIKKVLPKGTEIVKYTQDYQYAIKRINRGDMKTNPIVSKLKEYGLIDKKADEKFIPKKYLYSSIENRLKLLKGLMDTDGNVEIGSGARYTTVSEQLKEEIMELIRGLGGKATYRIEKPSVSYINERKVKGTKLVYRIRFNMLENPFELKRKREKFNPISRNYQKIVTNITKVRQEECQCIMVDHPEHLYVTDGYTLTHNTEVSKRFLAWSLGNNPDSPSIFVSYSASIAKDKRIYRNRCTNS